MFRRNFAFRYLCPDDPPPGGTPPATPPAAATPPATDPPDPGKNPANPNPAPNPSAQNNEENKFRRLHDQAQARIQQLEAEEQKRKDAELSETEREKATRERAEKERDDARLEVLRLKVGKDLPEEALEFLTGTDEATLTAQAEKLSKVYTKDPLKAGTVTLPGSNQSPSLDERIAAAEKAGHRTLAIELKREKAWPKT